MHACACMHVHIPSTLMDTFIRFAMVLKVTIAKKWTKSVIGKQLWSLANGCQYPGNSRKWTQPTQMGIPIAFSNPEKLRKKVKKGNKKVGHEQT